MGRKLYERICLLTVKPALDSKARIPLSKIVPRPNRGIWRTAELTDEATFATA